MQTASEPQPAGRPAIRPDTPLLSVQELEVEYRTRRGTVHAVNKVSFEIQHEEVFGLAGESGCGKSTVAHAVTRILHPPAYITNGQIMFNGINILEMNPLKLRRFR